MRKIKAKKLTKEAFEPYGSYYDFFNPQGASLGDFFPDRVIFPVGGERAMTFSPLTIHPDRKVTCAEEHNYTGEGIICFDDDMILHVAPASAEPCPQLTEAFIVPKGTVVKLHTGTWHAAPYSMSLDPAHVVIVLPERTYKIDCHVVQYDEKDQMEIKL